MSYRDYSINCEIDSINCEISPIFLAINSIICGIALIFSKLKNSIKKYLDFDRIMYTYYIWRMNQENMFSSQII